MAADAFFRRSNGLFFDVVNARTLEIVEELIDTRGDADFWVAEHNARAIEAEAAEQAALVEQEAEYLAQQREMDVIYREVARRYDADLPATAPRNIAVREILGAIDSLGRPDLEQKEAA